MLYYYLGIILSIGLEFVVNLSLNNLIMKSLNVEISEFEYEQFGLKKNTILFSDLVQIIRREILKQSLEKTLELAESRGLSAMTIDEFNEEIKAYRNEKNNS